MGYKERNEQTKTRNENLMIEAFVSLLKEHELQFESVSMDDIASTSGFTKRTLYKYFGNKEELLFEAMIRGYVQMQECIEEAYNNNIEEERLLVLAKAFYTFSEEYPIYFHLIMDYETRGTDFIDPSPRVKDCYRLGQVLIQYVNDAIVDGQKQGIYKSELNVEEMSLLIWSFTVGLFNTINKKTSYIKNVYNINKEELLFNGFNNMIGMLK